MTALSVIVKGASGFEVSIFVFIDIGNVAWYLPWPHGKLEIIGISKSPQISKII